MSNLIHEVVDIQLGRDNLLANIQPTVVLPVNFRAGRQRGCPCSQHLIGHPSLDFFGQHLLQGVICQRAVVVAELIADFDIILCGQLFGCDAFQVVADHAVIDSNPQLLGFRSQQFAEQNVSIAAVSKAKLRRKSARVRAERSFCCSDDKLIRNLPTNM